MVTDYHGGAAKRRFRLVNPAAWRSKERWRFTLPYALWGRVRPRYRRAMELFLDLHVHSRFSRAVSADMDLGHMYQWAQRKGIDIVATGDVLHPEWQKQLRSQLVPADGGRGEGLYELRPELCASLDEAVPRSCRRKVRFVLAGEISHIFKTGGKKDGAVRKVHNLIVLPSLEVAERLAERLLRLGYNLHSDGRPILGMPCRDFLELLLSTDAGAYLVPAHIWTPHFSVFGSMSGFDRLSDCFGDLTGQIFALETGLSSDPAMNWRLSALDQLTLLSSSDAHSPQKLGRELSRVCLPSPPTFLDLRRALELCSPDEFLGTVEFFPEEGKYHLDGHRDCGVRLLPSERAALLGRCPKCAKPVTVGVLSRVEALADRPEGSAYRPPRARPFDSLVPLTEVVADVLGKTVASDAVQRLYFKLLDQVGPELFVLRAAELDALHRVGDALLGEAILRMRRGALRIAAGFDGEYGRIGLVEASERGGKSTARQMGLFG